MQQGPHVVFCLNEIGVLGGVTSAVESLAGLLEEHGWTVSFLGITSRRRGPERDRRDWRPLVASPRLTSRIRGAGLANRVLRRADFALARRRLAQMPAGSVVVFTNVWVKKELDAAGYRGRDSGHYLVGQHHGSLAGSQASWEFDAMLDHYRDLDVFVALCEADAVDFAEHLDVPCMTLSNLVDLPALDRVPVPGRVVSVGRLDPNKDVERVVRLFERTRREAAAEWHLHVFGDGPSKSSVEEVVSGLGAEGSVTVHGVTNDALSEFRVAQVSVQASRSEGVPMTILEASSVGTPTVAGASSPGVCELLEGDRGWVVGRDDDDAFVAALHHAMGDIGENERRGALARASLEQKHGRGAVYREWVEVTHVR